MSNRLPNKLEAGILAATSGLTLALGGCATSPVEAKPADISAPVSTGSTDPTKTVFAPKDQSEIDLSVFPFVVDGKTYSGEESFKKACEISITEYPTAKDALPAILSSLNKMTRAGQTYDELVRYKDYFPQDEKYATMPAVVDSIYNKEYMSCLASSTQSAEHPGVLFENVVPTAVDNSIAWALSTKNGDKVPYTATYSADLSKADISNPNSNESSSFSNVTLDYSDNGDQNSVGAQRTKEHWLGIWTPRDYYKSTISGKVLMENGHWVIDVDSQHFIESSRPFN